MEITTVHAHQHGNRGRSELNFNGAIKLLARENPVWGNIRGSISCISRATANFVLKYPNFRCHDNRVRSDVKFNDIGKLPDLDTPCLVQDSGLYVLYWPSYG